jgi:hypothetical protein
MFRNVKGNKELTFIMILPLQMFDITQYLNEKKVENEEHALICSINFLFFGCILSQIYWVESQLRFEFE